MKTHTCRQWDVVFEYREDLGLGVWLVLDAHSETPGEDYCVCVRARNAQFRRLKRKGHTGACGVLRQARPGEEVYDPRPATGASAAA